MGGSDPFIESNIIPSLYESDGDTAVIAMDYTVGAGNDNDSYDTYTVHEYYRIRKTTRAMYLLNFERESNQVFDGRNDLLSSGKINLGIQPDSDIELMDDDKNITHILKMREVSGVMTRAAIHLQKYLHLLLMTQIT